MNPHLKFIHIIVCKAYIKRKECKHVVYYFFFTSRVVLTDMHSEVVKREGYRSLQFILNCVKDGLMDRYPTKLAKENSNGKI